MRRGEKKDFLASLLSGLHTYEHLERQLPASILNGFTALTMELYYKCHTDSDVAEKMFAAFLTLPFRFGAAASPTAVVSWKTPSERTENSCRIVSANFKQTTGIHIKEGSLKSKHNKRCFEGNERERKKTASYVGADAVLYIT